MNDADVRAKLVDILSVMLEIPVNEIADDLSGETCGTWDSVRHLSIVLAVEEEFGVTFDEAALADMANVPNLFSAICGALLRNRQADA